MNRKMFSRVVALFLAIIMIGSVAVMALQFFAISPDIAADSITMVNTGDEQGSKTPMIIVAAVAGIVVLCAGVIPMLTKKRK